MRVCQEVDLQQPHPSIVPTDVEGRLRAACAHIRHCRPLREWGVGPNSVVFGGPATNNAKARLPWNAHLRPSYHPGPARTCSSGLSGEPFVAIRKAGQR